MAFPAKTVSGETVFITEKVRRNGVEVFVAEDGSCYKPNKLNNLLLELVEEAKAAVEEAVEAAAETVKEALQTPIEVFETLINESADRAKAKPSIDAELAEGQMDVEEVLADVEANGLNPEDTAPLADEDELADAS